MPAIISEHSQLLQTKIDGFMQPLGGKPLGQKRPQFFIELCTAIATGLAASAITFLTTDTGVTSAPPKPGTGAGVGINMNKEFFSETLYTILRNQTLAQFGKCVHEAWPPSSGTGLFLKALTDGISEATEEHWKTAWILASAHPVITVGVGMIPKGSFALTNESSVASTMAAAAPNMRGPYWPEMCKKIAEAYGIAIGTESWGQVVISGVCVPSESQVCGIPSAGVGTGVAS